MIILGTKYKLEDTDREWLSSKVKDIHELDLISLSDEEVIADLKHYIEEHEPEFIVLNLEKKASIKLKGYLEELDYDGLKIMLYSQFTSKFLNRYHVEFNEDNFEALNSFHHDEKRQLTKRVFDFIFSFCIICFFEHLAAFSIVQANLTLLSLARYFIY